MRKLALLAAATITISLTSAQADPVFGEWKTQGSDVAKYAGHYLHVKLAPCQGKICGHITKVIGIDADIIGDPIIWDMQANKDGSYSGGTILGSRPRGNLCLQDVADRKQTKSKRLCRRWHDLQEPDLVTALALTERSCASLCSPSAHHHPNGSPQ